jgi:hypothetical protein
MTNNEKQNININEVLRIEIDKNSVKSVNNLMNTYKAHENIDSQEMDTGFGEIIILTLNLIDWGIKLYSTAKFLYRVFTKVWQLVEDYMKNTPERENVTIRYKDTNLAIQIKDKSLEDIKEDIMEKLGDLLGVVSVVGDELKK